MNIQNPKQAMLQSLQDSCSFNNYLKTLDLTTDISTDVAYQKNFTNYYRVRRDAQWLKEFYKFLEENKHNKAITFEEILRHLSNIEHKVRVTEKNKAGRAKTVEASFASKLLATINPNHPIWDSQVLRYMDITVDAALSHEDKINQCVQLYAQMEQEISAFIRTPSGQECIALFDKAFPYCTDFSDYKKIDFYLWNLGK